MKAGTEQLDGWKEIACHLKRSVRCVQRWERNEKLPVRRHEHAHGVSVYAFSNELEAWWRNDRRSSKKPLCKEISGTTAEEKTTKGSAENGEARIQGAGTADCSGRDGIQTGFELADREIAIVIFLLSLLKGMRLAKIPEQELQAIGARYELLRRKTTGKDGDMPNAAKHEAPCQPSSAEDASGSTTKSEIRRRQRPGRALACLVACAPEQTCKNALISGETGPKRSGNQPKPRSGAAMNQFADVSQGTAKRFAGLARRGRPNRSWHEISPKSEEDTKVFSIEASLKLAVVAGWAAGYDMSPELLEYWLRQLLGVCTSSSGEGLSEKAGLR